MLSRLLGGSGEIGSSINGSVVEAVREKAIYERFGLGNLMLCSGLHRVEMRWYSWCINSVIEKPRLKAVCEVGVWIL